MLAFDGLDGIEDGAPLVGLKKRPLRDLQRALSVLTYRLGMPDGLYGPKTRSAWAEFKADLGVGNPELVDKASAAALKAQALEVNGVLAMPSSTKEETRAAIAALCRRMGLGRDAQIAYVLATAQWETAHTFEPVREAYWLKNAEAWRKAHLKYWPYYGRGYVQLTWKNNYELYGAILDQPLVDKPDLALDHAAALFVLVHGFKVGGFTGHGLEEYVNATGTDFRRARYCINGQDKAHEIALVAEDYLDDM